MSTRKALVTGGSGFIGSHMVDLLLREGYEKVYVIDPKPRVVVDPRVRFLQETVQIADARGFWPKVDVIFHLAGYVGPTGVLDVAGKIVKSTVEMADIVSHWARQVDAVLIDVSTSEVYGSPDSANKETDPLVFSAASSARREYAIGKLAAEAMLIERRQGIIIRPFNVAGPRQLPDGGFVLPRFIQQALAGSDITVYSPGTQQRTFTHVKDLVGGMYLAYLEGIPGQVYNIGNDLSYLHTSKSKIVHVNPVELHGYFFKEAPQKIANSSKARTELGWEPVFSMDDIIQDTIWYWKAEGQ
jgi:UDP-glucose 4-epimerase